MAIKSLATLMSRIASYGQALDQHIDTTPAQSAGDATRVGGQTATEIRNSVTKADVGLGNVPNYPAANDTQAKDPNNNNTLMAPTTTRVAYNQRMGTVGGNPGDFLYSTGNGFELDKMFGRLSIVTDEAERVSMMATEESFSTVFNTWSRISHGANTSPLNPTELTSWTYDDVNDQITCTVNSASLVGFISPVAYGDYTFEVRCSSTGGDNDSIGICFGFMEEDGREHTLVAMRTPGGSQTHPPHSGTVHRAKLFDVYYNIFDTDKIDLGSTSEGLFWGDTGLVDPDRVTNDVGSWGAYPNGCLIKAVRVGDTITLSTTNLDSDVYVPEAEVVIDLTAIPELNKFRGRVKLGYVAYSQPTASWDAIQRPGSRSAIVEMTTLNVDEWDGSAWVSAANNAYTEYIKPGRFYFNPVTGKTFYAEQADRLIHVMG